MRRNISSPLRVAIRLLGAKNLRGHSLPCFLYNSSMVFMLEEEEVEFE